MKTLILLSNQQVGQRYCPVWRAKNRVNDLVYGYSGIKLFPTQKVLDLEGKKVTDFTTSVSVINLNLYK